MDNYTCATNPLGILYIGMAQIRTKICRDVEVIVGCVELVGGSTGFTLKVIMDPEQHGKYLHFYNHSAESIVEAVKKFIEIRDSLNNL